MGLYRIEDGALTPVESTRFAEDDIRERADLQRMLREAIGVVVPGAMVLAEEFSDWEDSRRRIDLLCLDEDANLVVVELKRGETGAHMELQALRYAAMVSGMTFARAVSAHERFLSAREAEADAEERILGFLGWDEPDEDTFARDVRIVLVAADFSTEITTTVLWLIERGLDIRCVRMYPHRLGDQTLVSVEQVIPLPSAEAYQVRLREKSVGARESRLGKRCFTGYWFFNVGEHDGPGNHRSWDDSREHGFLSAGGKSVEQIVGLRPGDRVLAYRNGHGYVGAGVVTTKATHWQDFEVDGRGIGDLSLMRPLPPPGGDRARQEHFVGIRWLKTVDRGQAVKAAFRRPTACRIRDHALVAEVLAGLSLDGTDWPG